MLLCCVAVLTVSYQCGVAGEQQQSGSEALGEQSFLAEVTDAPHHHQRFPFHHIWLDPGGIAQQGGGEIHQRIRQLQTQIEAAQVEDKQKKVDYTGLLQEAYYNHNSNHVSEGPRLQKRAHRRRESLPQHRRWVAGASRTGCKQGSIPFQRLHWKRARFPLDSLSAGKEASVCRRLNVFTNSGTRDASDYKAARGRDTCTQRHSPSAASAEPFLRV